eukprot:m.280696 g.280696  ORF g.280696 m.280696 type:complete len:1035 (-) comp19827_c0_seq9:75-3179(-)
MSPEALSGEGYGDLSDMWSLGVIAFEMCQLRKPFRGKSLVQVIKNICVEPIPSVQADKYQVMAQVVPLLLERDPTQRVDAEKFRKLPILSESRRRNSAVCQAYSEFMAAANGRALVHAVKTPSEDPEGKDGDSESSSYDTASDSETESLGSPTEDVGELNDCGTLLHEANDSGTTLDPVCAPKDQRTQDTIVLGDLRAKRQSVLQSEAATLLDEAVHVTKFGEHQLDSQTKDLALEYYNSGYSQVYDIGDSQCQRPLIAVEHDRPHNINSNSRMQVRESQMKKELVNDDGREGNKAWKIPYLPTPYFTGREEELQSLYTSFFVDHQYENGHTDRGIRHCICQHGGAGKTELMLKFAWMNRHSYPGGIFLVDATSPQRLQSSFASIAEHLDNGKQIASSATHAKIADDVCTLLVQTTKQWLVCVDAADGSEVQQLLSEVYFPRDRLFGSGHILFSSRSCDKTLWGTIGVDNLLVVDMLPSKPAAELLFRYAHGMHQATSWEVESLISELPPAERIALHNIAGNDVACSLGGLPLALEQAGAYICRTKTTFHEYSKIYETQCLELLEQGNGNVQETVAPNKESTCVATTWAINIEGLSDVTLDILGTISCLASFKIPEALILSIVKVYLEESTGTLATEDAVQEQFQRQIVDELLSRFSVLQLTVRTSTTSKSLHREYSMHRLVQLVVRNKLQHRAEKLRTMGLKGYYACVRERSYHTVTSADRDVRHVMTEMSVHGRSLLTAGDEVEEACPLECGIVYRAEGFISQFNGEYNAAVADYEKSIDLLRNKFGNGDNLEIAATINQLGSVLCSRGDNSVALERCEEALHMYQRIIGTAVDDAGVASILHRIATVHVKLDHEDLALEKFEQALQMKRRLYGEHVDHSEIASTQYRIGNIFESKKQYQVALERYLEALQMKRRLYKDNEPRADLAYCLFSIGSVLLVQGGHAKAEENFQEALRMRRRIYGEDTNHTSIASSLQSIGQCMFEAGNFEGALEKFQAALAMRQIIYGREDHPEIQESRKSVDDAEQASLMVGW